jgi:hypothetical protein
LAQSSQVQEKNKEDKEENQKRSEDGFCLKVGGH